MKICSRIEITSMLPNGIVTGVDLLGIKAVGDDYEFGLQQELKLELSPVTRKLVQVWHPVLHAEGEATELLAGDSE